MKNTIKVIALIVLGLSLFALSLKLVLANEIFGAFCVYISSVACVFLSADYSTRK